MRYKSISDLPETLREVLPDEAQRIYLEAYKKGWEEYEEWQGGEMSREAVAHQRGWAAMEEQFELNEKTGLWHRKGEEIVEEGEPSLLDKAKDLL